MNILAAAMLVIVGVIHLLPLTGVLSSNRLTQLYGLPFEEANLAVLMRHRAVLFGLLGLFFVYAAFSPPVRTLALIAGFVSVISFLWLTWPVSQYNSQLGRVFRADVIALGSLIVGLIAHLSTPTPQP